MPNISKNMNSKATYSLAVLNLLAVKLNSPKEAVIITPLENIDILEHEKFSIELETRSIVSSLFAATLVLFISACLLTLSVFAVYVILFQLGLVRLFI